MSQLIASLFGFFFIEKQILHAKRVCLMFSQRERERGREKGFPEKKCKKWINLENEEEEWPTCWKDRRQEERLDRNTATLNNLPSKPYLSPDLAASIQSCLAVFV